MDTSDFSKIVRLLGEFPKCAVRETLFLQHPRDYEAVEADIFKNIGFKVHRMKSPFELWLQQSGMYLNAVFLYSNTTVLFSALFLNNDVEVYIAHPTDNLLDWSHIVPIDLRNCCENLYFHILSQFTAEVVFRSVDGVIFCITSGIELEAKKN
jgi:hypothetical protein